MFFCSRWYLSCRIGCACCAASDDLASGLVAFCILGEGWPDPRQDGSCMSEFLHSPAPFIPTRRSLTNGVPRKPRVEIVTPPTPARVPTATLYDFVTCHSKPKRASVPGLDCAPMDTDRYDTHVTMHNSWRLTT